jgi:hypothetical protein
MNRQSLFSECWANVGVRSPREGIIQRFSRFCARRGNQKARRAGSSVGFLGVTLAVWALAMSGCEDRQGISRPLTRVEQDDESAMLFDAERAFQLRLGRGSGWHGLETIAIEPSGATTMYRGENVEWETATMMLDAEALAAIGRAVADEEIARMHREYHGDVVDGTQWVLVLTQGERVKRVYFNNHFPSGVVRLAEVVDREASRCGAGNLTWESVPEERAREHEIGFWELVKK